MVWHTYKEKIKRLSERIVDAQRPIRVLDAIKWDPAIEQSFKKNKFKELPDVDAAYYQKSDLGYDPVKKSQELEEIIQDIRLTLGKEDPLTGLLVEVTQQYIDVVHMIQSRGTKQFSVYSKKLYGSPKDTFYDEKNTILSLGQLLYTILNGMGDQVLGHAYPAEFPAEEVVKILGKRFRSYFTESDIEVKISDGIVADASAGGDVVKIKEGALFSSRDIDILEVHEGWVHIGTTQNGKDQHVAKWLSKGPPRCASTQEGLAVIMEIFTFRTYPKRAKKINDRILAVDKAEEGANFIDIFEFFRTEGYSEDECITHASRVCRGGLVQGGAPFTKDISYCRGFIENYNFMRAAIRAGRPYLIPFLFCGKMNLRDVPLLYQKYKEGIIDAPRYLPPQFRDMNGIAVWMSFSSFLNMIDLQAVQESYNKLFETYS